MLGNYEFYYAAGILCGELGIPVEAEIQPQELYELIHGNTDDRGFEDSKVAHLVKMMYYYMPEEGYDAQMKELLQLGLAGKT